MIQVGIDYVIVSILFHPSQKVLPGHDKTAVILISIRLDVFIVKIRRFSFVDF